MKLPNQRITTYSKEKENTMKNNNKGFTLIELIMVTIILGILAAVAVPRYMSSVASAEAAAYNMRVDFQRFFIDFGCDF